MEETPEMNNHYEKPIHGKMEMGSTNIGGSANPLQQEQVEVSNPSFEYLKNKDISVVFKDDGAEIEDIYLDLKNNCKFVICILAKDDTCFSSSLLKKTLNGIKFNLAGINNLIEPENAKFLDEILLSSKYDYTDYIINNWNNNINNIWKL